MIDIKKFNENIKAIYKKPKTELPLFYKLVHQIERAHLPRYRVLLCPKQTKWKGMPLRQFDFLIHINFHGSTYTEYQTNLFIKL